MSCYIVDREHIHTLAKACSYYLSDEGYYYLGQWHRVVDLKDLNRTGQILLAENNASYNKRYNANEDAEEYTYKTPQHLFEPVEILKAVHGYEYQTCQSKTWEISEAKKICNQLARSIIYRLPGYEEADTWEITPETKSLILR